jgi:hypothetical protein
MSNRPFGMKLFSLIGFFVGLLALYTVYHFKLGISAYWLLGLFCIILSFAILTMSNLARIIFMAVSVIFACLYILSGILLFVFKPDEYQWGILSLVLFSPVFLLSLYSLVYLTRQKVKEQFK